MTDAKKDEEARLKSMINGSGDIAGAAIGGALGFMAAGPIGAGAGGAAGTFAAQMIKKIGNDAASRVLSAREEVRVGGAIAIAADHIRARAARGERLRSDGYFENTVNGRTDAEEVSEKVLLTSQREAEERKIPYMAFLIGNIAFDSTISAPLAHQIIKAAEVMTYRQLCLLKLAAFKSEFRLRQSDYRGVGSFEKSLYEILYECLDLYHRGFVNFGGEVAFGPTDVKPGSMTIQAVGADIFNQMGLATIPTSDIVPIANRLSG